MRHPHHQLVEWQQVTWQPEVTQLDTAVAAMICINKTKLPFTNKGMHNITHHYLLQRYCQHVSIATKMLQFDS